jgi:hypothetical protein
MVGDRFKIQDRDAEYGFSFDGTPIEYRTSSSGGGFQFSHYQIGDWREDRQIRVESGKDKKIYIFEAKGYQKDLSKPYLVISNDTVYSETKFSSKGSDAFGSIVDVKSSTATITAMSKGVEVGTVTTKTTKDDAKAAKASRPQNLVMNGSDSKLVGCDRLITHSFQPQPAASSVGGPSTK